MAKAVQVIQLSEKEIEALINKAADAAVAKYKKDDTKIFATKDELKEIITQIGKNLRSVVREEIDKALDEKLITKDSLKGEILKIFNENFGHRA